MTDLLLSGLLYNSELLLRWVKARMVVEEVGNKCKIELLMAIHHVLGSIQ